MKHVFSTGGSDISKFEIRIEEIPNSTSTMTGKSFEVTRISNGTKNKYVLIFNLEADAIKWAQNEVEDYKLKTQHLKAVSMRPKPILVMILEILDQGNAGTREIADIINSRYGTSYKTGQHQQSIGQMMNNLTIRKMIEVIGKTKNYRTLRKGNLYRITKIGKAKLAEMRTTARFPDL